MNFFDQFPEFIEADSRKDRGYSRVTSESISNRHEAILPDWLVYGANVLDLGSCFGATGHWVLSKGAKSYTGVEVQPAMANASKKLLSKYWPDEKFTIVQENIKTFLDSEIEKGNKYDVISFLGVLYAFVNPFGILEKLTKLSNHAIVIDSLYPYVFFGPESTVLEIAPTQHINSSIDKSYHGIGCKVSPNALRFIMGLNGFKDKEGLIYPKPLVDKSIHDSFNNVLQKNNYRAYPTPARFLIRFYKSEVVMNNEVAENVANDNKDTFVPLMPSPEIISNTSWTFDNSVAERFQVEANTHIPDYQRVIDLCLDVTKEVYGSRKDISIVDVGSALGHTMEMFISKGYSNVKGIENSPSMINLSKHKDKVTLSDKFVIDSYDLVLANWTLHFIQNREDYLRDIFNCLNPEGTLILSDKMSHSIDLENLYYKWKKSQGVSQEVIDKKKHALVGVLTPKPLSWYLETLKDIGFSSVEVINNKFMFTTLYARKL